MAENRKNLQAAVLFVVVFLSPAIQTTSLIRAAARDMKALADGLITYMQQESTCIAQNPEEPPAVGCLRKPETDSSFNCSLILTFDAYWSKAIALNIGDDVSTKLKAVKENLEGLRRRACRAAPKAKSCDEAFTDTSDGAYEKFCKVLNLAELLKLWLDKLIN